MPQIDVLVLVCSGKYLLILDSYRSLYEGYGIKYAQQKCQKQDKCRLLDYRVIKNNRPITDYFENAKYRPIYRPYRLIGSSLFVIELND